VAKRSEAAGRPRRPPPPELTALLGEVLEATSDLVFAANPGEELLYLNAAGRRMLGFAPDEDLSPYRLSHLHPAWAYLRVRDEGIPAAVRHGVWSGETAFLSRDQREVPTSQVILAHRSPAGKLTCLSTIARDISERKQAERALQESERRHRMLAEAAHDFIFVINHEDRVEYVNRFAAQQVGSRPEELIGRPRAELFPPPVAEQQGRSLRRVFETGESLYAEAPLPTPGGEIWLGTWLVPLRREGGEVKAVLGMARDLTERRKAEEALRASEAELARRNQELAAISTLVGAVTTQLDLNRTLDCALRGALQLTGLAGGALYLINREQQVLEVAATHNVSDEMVRELKSHRIRVGDCLCGHAAQTGEPLILWDNASGSEYATLEAVRKGGLRFYAAFPFRAKGEVSGVLCIFACDAARPTGRSLDLVSDLCGPVSLAIENARLHENAQRHAAELERQVGERERAEQALQERDQQVRMAVQAGRMGLWRVDLHANTIATLHGGGPVSGGSNYPRTQEEFLSRMALP
jgi:PAS domain S-box-containing protein